MNFYPLHKVIEGNEFWFSIRVKWNVARFAYNDEWDFSVIFKHSVWQTQKMIKRKKVYIKCVKFSLEFNNLANPDLYLNTKNTIIFMLKHP